MSIPALVYFIVVKLVEALLRETASLARYDGALARVKLSEKSRHQRVILRIILASLDLSFQFSFIFSLSLAKSILQEILSSPLLSGLLL